MSQTNYSIQPLTTPCGVMKRILSSDQQRISQAILDFRSEMDYTLRLTFQSQPLKLVQADPVNAYGEFTRVSLSL